MTPPKTTLQTATDKHLQQSDNYIINTKNSYIPIIRLLKKKPVKQSYSQYQQK